MSAKQIISGGWFGLLLLAGAAPGLHAHELASLERGHTQPDPSASGGIVGRMGMTYRSPLAVVAVNRTDPSKMYLGTIEEMNTFRFEGLPVGRYDLAVIYPDAIFEGFGLSRENTLTSRDLEQIEENLKAGNPFFETKHIHRVEGSTGTGNYARAILEEKHVRREGEIRSVKLVTLMRVGEVGWQITHSREIARTHRAAPGYTIADLRTKREITGQIRGGTGLLTHQYRPGLGGIRVVDSVRDIGTIR